MFLIFLLEFIILLKPLDVRVVFIATQGVHAFIDSAKYIGRPVFQVSKLCE